jgi:hypothetical protein
LVDRAASSPLIRNASEAEQVLSLPIVADLTDTAPDVNEAEEIRWVPLTEAVAMIDRGEIVGAAAVVAVYRALTLAK